jgi:hypothetical protein
MYSGVVCQDCDMWVQNIAGTRTTAYNADTGNKTNLGQPLMWV